MATIPTLPFNGQQLHAALTALNTEVGADAYEVAVATGFVGTRAQWLASLKGDPGDNGVTPDVQVFDTYAEALAYSTANPAAIVFSEQEAP